MFCMFAQVVNQCDVLIWNKEQNMAKEHKIVLLAEIFKYLFKYCNSKCKWKRQNKKQILPLQKCSYAGLREIETTFLNVFWTSTHMIRSSLSWSRRSCFCYLAFTNRGEFWKESPRMSEKSQTSTSRSKGKAITRKLIFWRFCCNFWDIQNIKTVNYCQSNITCWISLHYHSSFSHSVYIYIT